MDREKIITHLKSQRTWRLVLLSIVTLGIYAAHYIKHQTEIINEYFPHNKRISAGFVNTIQVLFYVSALLIIPYFLVEQGNPVQEISDILDKALAVFVIVWAFKAKNRLNELLSASPHQRKWFNGVGAFFFTVFYFNFKINWLSENTDELDG